MTHCKIYFMILVLFGGLFSAVDVKAADDDDLLSLEAEMLKYINTHDAKAFFNASEQLKEASKEAGNERLFYKAWSKQAIYNATQQYYTEAVKTAEEMTEYARQDGSIYGEYAALHTTAMVQLQQANYASAEKAFLKAVDFRHRHFPNESAAEDLRELMKIAYLNGDTQKAKNFANQLLSEPNLLPHHKGRTLDRLSIMAFEENDVEEFNRVYNEMKKLEQANGIWTTNAYTELNHYIINGDYKHALLLADRLPADTCAERKAIIYHRLGDNEKAYEYMVQYKHISDSISHASHNSTMGSLYLRINNDRLRLEREVLTNQNNKLRFRFYIAIGIFLILTLIYMVYKRHKIIKMLKHSNTLLDYGKKGVERTLKDLNELSYYESKTDLPLTSPVKVNKLCDHLTNITQNHCNTKVTTVFQSDFTDDTEIATNPDALEKLLGHLLNYFARFTHEGAIILKCSDSDSIIRFTISNDSLTAGKRTASLLAEQDEDIRLFSVNFNICQSIARLLHGHIWHDETYSDGTRFCFEISKTPPPTPSTPIIN